MHLGGRDVNSVPRLGGGGYLEAMADGRQLTDAHKMGLHLPIGTRNGSSRVSVPCHPPSLPANQTSPTYQPFSSTSLLFSASVAHCKPVDIMIHVFFASCSPDRWKQAMCCVYSHF